MQKHVPRICSVPCEAQGLQGNLHFMAQQARHKRLQAVKRVHHTAVGCTEEMWKQHTHASFSACSLAALLRVVSQEHKKATGPWDYQQRTFDWLLGAPTGCHAVFGLVNIFPRNRPNTFGKFGIVINTPADHYYRHRSSVSEILFSPRPHITLDNHTHRNCAFKQHLSRI